MRTMGDEQLRVLATGVCGRMGRFVVEAVTQAPDMQLVGAVDPAGQGRPLAEVIPSAPADIIVSGHLVAALEQSQPQIMVDFTAPAVVRGNVEAALSAGVACVVGTTGFSPTDLQVVAKMCARKQTPCMIAPNFSIGANLMMKFAAEAAKAFEYAEIIERHHEGKVDAPSGTALTTAEMMASARPKPVQEVPTSHDKLPGSRGGVTGERIHIHSVRMPGYVANQEVVLGGPGEVLKIEHITTSRECFIPGVLLAIRKVLELEGLVYGLEKIL